MIDEVHDVPTFSSDFKNYFLNDKKQQKKKNKKKTKNIDENEDENNEENNEEIEEIEDGEEDLDNSLDGMSDEDKEDFTIHPSDNLILCATAQDDISNLEVYIYDEAKQSLFIHHDILLASYPLCLEWLSIPEENGTKANFAVIGTFLPEIEIWNLDSINDLEPELVLGDNDKQDMNDLYKKSKKKKTVINPKDTKYHTDAVLGISLNPFDKKMLASGSADSKVILWDLWRTEPILNYFEHSDKVQTVKFNKCEDNVMLSGSYDHTIKIYDIRQSQSVLKLNVNSDIESIEFSPLNKYKFMVSFENGLIEEYDINNLSKPLFSFKGHKKAATAVTYSNQIPDLFVSCSMDSHLKVWDSNIDSMFKNEMGKQPVLLAEKFLKKTSGELFCCKFADDLDYTLAVGGSRGELLIWQLEQCKTFCDRYNLDWIDENSIKKPSEYNNIAKKKLMGNRIKFRKEGASSNKFGSKKR
jgi:periodic tryptophan protein 1